MTIQKIFSGILFLAFAFPLSAVAEEEAPKFDYGYGESHFKWGVEVPITDKESDFKLRIGTRIQSIMDNTTSVDAAGKKSDSQDFYVRRARLQVEAKFQENLSYYMDIRADRIDQGNQGANTFAIGDAFFQVKNIFGSEWLSLRLFRAKYDVSRTETVSSSRLLTPNRAPIADFAAEYISAARRGTNVQILGNWKNRIQGQIVMGDSVQATSFKDSLEKKVTKLNSQNFAYGARLRISPFYGWEEGDLTETYFGKGQHFTMGAGYYAVNNVNFSTASQTYEVDRKLANFDLSFHYGPFSLIGEYFNLDGMIDDFSSTAIVEGKSNGWFAQSEFVFTQFHYLAPYVRQQNWNRFKEKANHDETSTLVGLNYYIKGDKLRVGVYHEQKKYGSGLVTAGFNQKETTIGANLMMHY